MKKVFNKYLIITIIITVFYNLLVFLIPTTPMDKVNFWLTYSFGLLCIISQPVIAYYGFKNEGLKSKLYGWPILKIGYLYFVVQLAITLIAFIVGLFVVIPNWVLIILNGFVIGFVLIGLLILDAYRETIESIEEKTSANTTFINNLHINISILSSDIKDENLIKEIKILSDEIRFSDPVSNESVYELENEIDTLYITLKEYLELDNVEQAILMTKKIVKLVKERNLRIKLNKR